MKKSHTGFLELSVLQSLVVISDASYSADNNDEAMDDCHYDAAYDYEDEHEESVTI